MFQLAVMGMQEWGIILLVVLILFGARKLPELARSMGSSVNQFKKGMKEGALPDDSPAEKPAAAESKEP
jgi:sec-independent protein translocase protein TatA